MTKDKSLHLLNSVWQQSLDLQTKTMLFSYQSREEMRDLLSQFIKGLEPKPTLLWNSDPCHDQPYFPFLDWIYFQWEEGEADFEDVLHKVPLYELHRPIFSSDFRGEVPQRTEEVVFEELEYEKDEMFKGLYRLLEYTFFEKPLIIILEDINLYTYSSMRFVDHILSHSPKKPILIILTENARNTNPNRFANKFWLEETQHIQRESLKIQLHGGQPDAIKEGQWYTPSLVNLQRMYGFFCLEDCVFLDEYFELNTDPDLEKTYLHLMAEVNLLFGEYSRAMLLYRGYLSQAKKENDVRSMAYVYRKLGLIYFNRNNISEAKKWALGAYKFAKSIQNKEEIFYALFLLLIIEPREPFLGKLQWVQHFQTIVDYGEELGFKNNLAYRMSKPDGMNPIDDEFMIEEFLEKSISLASSLGNELRVANAYHILGYNKLYAGKTGSVLQYYQRSEAIRQRLGNPLELAYLYNGMGYFLHQMGDFGAAGPYLYQSLEKAIEAKDYHEVCMALCNIGINFMYSQEYEAASLYQEKVLQLMEIAGIQNLSFHTRREVLLLYSVASFMEGNIAKAYERYNEIVGQNALFKPAAKTSSEQDQILIGTFFEVLISEGADGQGVDQALMEKQKALLMEHYDIINYRLPYFLLFYGDLLFRQGKLPEAREQWEEGLEIAHRHDFRFYQKIIRGRLEFRPSSYKGAPIVQDFDFDLLMRTAKSDMDYQKLHKIVDKIDFLNDFQLVLDTPGGQDDLDKKVSELIQSTFPADYLHILQLEAVLELEARGETEITGWKVLVEALDSDLGWKALRPDSSHFAQLLKEHPMGGILEGKNQLLRGTPFQSMFFLVIRRKDQAHLVIILGSTQRFLFNDGEDFKILEIAGNQYLVAKEKLQKDHELQHKNRLLQEANQELEKLASTDPLTGLANRAELLRFLHIERERLERYRNKRGTHLTLIFMDLDFFKKYNDTYGHDVGDMVLVEIAGILRKSIRTVDLAARYGGDEFVLVLPETNAEEGKALAIRIQKQFRAAQGFSHLLAERGLDKDSIPPSQHIGCSIGVAKYENGKDVSPSKLLKAADSALYEAKKSAKGSIVIFNDWESLNQDESAEV
jgi:diguanylate cyclase (GGDEF)-like protein